MKNYKLAHNTIENKDWNVLINKDLTGVGYGSGFTATLRQHDANGLNLFYVDITAGGINVTAGLTTLTDVNVGSAITVAGIGTFQDDLYVKGDLSVVGILTVGSSSITIDGSTNKVNVGTGITIDATAQTITVGTSKIADSSGDGNYVGIVTASKFVVGVGGTNLLTEIGTKTSIGLVLALS